MGLLIGPPGGGGAQSGYTATHYVDIYTNVGGSPTGDDDAQDATAFSNATSSGSPCTLACAFANATAGDVVEVAPGTYTGAGGSGSSNPAFAVGNAGTSGNPVTFYAKFPAAYNASQRSKLRDSNQPASPAVATCPVLSLHHYTIVDGFWFDYADNARPHSRGVVYLPFNTDGAQLRRLRFDRTDLGSNDDGDNYNCIHFHGNADVVVSDCRFTGGYPTATSPGRNPAAVSLYGAYNYLIQHCEFNHMECGFFQKGSASGAHTDVGVDGVIGNYGTLRYNRFIDCARPLHAGEGEDGADNNFYQNLVYYTQALSNVQYGFEFDNSVGAKNIRQKFYNNTIVSYPNSGNGGVLSDTGNAHTNSVFRDNIICCVDTNAQVLQNFFAHSSMTAFDTFDYNWYYNNGATSEFAFDGTANYTFAQWKTNAGVDANGNEGNPNFTDAAAYDFTIASGAALTASSTGGPVGCYITGNEEIGLRASPTY